MKKTLALLLVSFAPISAFAETVSTENPLPMPALFESRIMPISEEPLMCTMDYTPVCGTNGITYGNACGAGKNPIAYKGECESFVDATAYAKLEKSKTLRLKKQLSKFDEKMQIKALESIDSRIAMVKMSRISKEMQVEKITILTFIKNTLNEVLGGR